MYFNLFALSNLLIVLTCLPLAIFVLIKGKTKLSKIYSLEPISISIWGVGGLIATTTHSSEISLLWWKIGYGGVILTALFITHLVFILTPKLHKSILVFSYVQAIIFLILNFQGILFSDTKFMFHSFYYAQGGIVYLFSFLSWIGLVSYANIVLSKFCFNNNEGNKYLFFFVAALVGFGGGVMNFLPAFGIELYPFGNFFIPLHVFIVAYTILKYQIFDMQFVFKKGFVYSILIASIAAMYSFFIFLAEKFLQGMVGYTSFIVSILCAFIVALFFIPVRNKIQHLADRLFLEKDPIQIAQENEFLRQELLRSERSKAVATFASGMAHEIKNPLTAIKTFAEYLPQKLNDSEFIQKFSAIVNSEVQKIDNLVHQLLDFSKPATLQLKEVNIHNLIDETLELLSSQFIKGGIKTQKEYCDSHLLIKVDPQQMKQVFLNLFLNAIDAMPKGGSLFIKTSQEVNQLVISIEDTGCGIPEKDLPHIFEPFYSLKEKGTGLGLSIVYNIIKEHKGKIEVESQLKQGSKFNIKLIKV